MKVVVMGCMALLALFASEASAQARYRVVPMPSAWYPWSIDTGGKVLGLSKQNHERVLCGKSACNAVLPRRAGYDWWAVNGDHMITGSVRVGSEMWMVRKAKLQEPDLLTYGVGMGIGADGTVVGENMWGNPIVFTDHLQTLPGINGAQGSARAINSSHVVVGDSQVTPWPDWTFHATMWVNGAAIDLGVLPGDASSIAYSVNKDGVAVGISYDGSRGIPPKPVRFADGSIQAFTLPHPDDYATAYAINDAGTIVGDIHGLSSGESVAGIVDGDRMVDLNERLVSADRSRYLVFSAGAINNAGQIAGTAFELATGEQMAVRLDPVR